jgi:hypothetical protein
MTNSRDHESEDLRDYEVLDGSDTLDGDPGDDPLDRGVATPDRWSAGMRYALEGDEDAESLDELLAEEEPDIDDDSDDETWDENATREDVARLDRDEIADRRAGRLVTEDESDYDDGDTPRVLEDELVARDEGIDGGGATAEEAALHVTDGSEVPYDED